MDSSHGANRFTGTIVIGRVGPEPATPGKRRSSLTPDFPSPLKSNQCVCCPRSSTRAATRVNS